MFRKLARQAACGALVFASFALGLLAGFWLSGKSFGPEVAGLLGAFLGAVITVLGAFWLSSHREQTAREQLRGILLAGVRTLDRRAEEAVPRTPDAAREFVRVLYHRWQYLEAFSPYRELADFDQMSAMANLDTCCRALQRFFAESGIQGAGGASRLEQPFGAQNMAATLREIDAIRIEIHHRCQDAKRALQGSARQAN